ncbi:S49 family peptidase [Roseibium alexandrii]|uniref:S49 family peptidase n=1 Tax=Roseibium alexandrii TaxID=388408 RepID=UPI003750F48C
MSALDSALSAPWAMPAERVEELLQIASRANETSFEVLEKYALETAERGENLKVRDDVAVLDVVGPLFKRANLFVKVSGATSYEVLMRDLQVALDDDQVSSIILRVDSPGGEANGCDELAAAIYSARGRKPITAYVSGAACSGGYWIAAAADRIVVSEGAVLGSIGVVLGLKDTAEADASRGIKTYQFVSSMSPGKRPDPATTEGKARFQKQADDLGEVFVKAVAKYRGVDAETVVKDFGAGGVEIGANAVAAGMADEVGQFEAVFSALSKRGERRFNQSSHGGFQMSENTTSVAEGSEQGADLDKVRKDAADITRDRIKTILSSDEGKAMPVLAEHLAYETDVSGSAAVAIMAAGQKDLEAKTPDTQDYEARKEDAGALGFGTPTDQDKPKADHRKGWAAAVENANKSIGA